MTAAVSALPSFFRTGSERRYNNSGSAGVERPSDGRADKLSGEYAVTVLVDLALQAQQRVAQPITIL